VDRRLVFIAILAFLAPAAAFAGEPPGSPRSQHTTADTLRAKRTVIRLSDLPTTFRIDRTGRGVPMIPQCGAYPGDRSNTTITGEATSSFTDGFDITGSRALFFKSGFDIERYWRQTVRAAFAACDAYVLKQNLKPGAKGRTLLARELPIDRTGADAAAVYRTITRFSVPGHPSYDWYQTTVFVRVGRALAMAKTSYANQPCDCYAAIARGLTRRLREAQRA
jgi:hypothetical protein